MESLFINSANRQGVNYGVYYFLGAFISFFVGQVIGIVPIILVLIFKGAFSLDVFNDISNLSNYGISHNLSLFLLLLPFFFSAVLLALFVKWVHKRPFLTIITPFQKFNSKRFFFGFFVWLSIIAAMELFNYVQHQFNYIYQFNAQKFLILCLVSIPLLLVQTSFEELLFRGYGMQWLGRYFSKRIFPLLITSVIFAGMHIMNPEIGKFGYQLLFDYFFIGLIMGLVTLLSDSLELAMGLHFANNLFLSLFVTFDSSVLQTDAVFRLKEMQFDFTTQILNGVLLIVFFIIVKMRFKLKPIQFLFQNDNIDYSIKK